MSTFINYKGMSSRKISIRRGVKQGDPLSSLLFNLVIDELLVEIENQFAYTIHGDIKINVRCFADDLVLFSSSKVGMGELVIKTESFLHNRQLKINAKKCISIGLEKAYKGKKSKIVT